LAEHTAYITAHASIADKAIYRNKERIFVGEPNSNVNTFLLDAYKHLHIDYPKFYKMDNLCKLGFLATEVLLSNQQHIKNYKPEETGIVCSNKNASLDADLSYFETVKNIPSPAQFVYTLPNIVIGEISIRHHFKGENAFFVSETFDAEFMWFYVNNLLNRTMLKACIFGWLECLGDAYQAVLWLVEKETEQQGIAFTIDHIHQIYELANGEING